MAQLNQSASGREEGLPVSVECLRLTPSQGGAHSFFHCSGEERDRGALTAAIPICTMKLARISNRLTERTRETTILRPEVLPSRLQQRQGQIASSPAIKAVRKPANDQPEAGVMRRLRRSLAAAAAPLRGLQWDWLRQRWFDGLLAVGFVAVGLLASYLVLLGR